MNTTKDRLIFILQNTNDWLKFAETKNAAIIAFDGAVLGAIMGNYDKISGVLLMFVNALLIPCLFLSLFGSLSSFLPKLSTKFLKKTRSATKRVHINHVYFGHLKDLNVDELYEAIKLENEPSAMSSFERDVCAQIILNSYICWYKYLLFSISCAFVFLGLLSFCFGLFIKAVLP